MSGLYPESDLVYNRAGQLSPAQQERLHAGWRVFRWLGGGLTAFMVGLGIFFWLSGDAAGLFATWFFALIVVGALYSFRSTMEQIRQPGQVARVKGRVRREMRSDDDEPSYLLRVGDLSLRMEQRDYDYFEDGAAYRVYYVPATHYVVSAESFWGDDADDAGE